MEIAIKNPFKAQEENCTAYRTHDGTHVVAVCVFVPLKVSLMNVGEAMK